MLSVAQAAEKLNVSPARVRQLIAAGELGAEKAGASWLVEEASVDRRLLLGGQGGRPKKGQEHKVDSYTLMSRNHEVARCKYDHETGRFSFLEVLDESRVPFPLLSYRAQGQRIGKLNEWWGRRAIPSDRPEIETRLNELDLLSTFEIPFDSLGFSLSDQYWLCPDGADLHWEDLNYFTNEFDTVPVRGGESLSEWLSAVGLSSPDNTSDGQLPKRWLMDAQDRRVLIKGAPSMGQEAINELIATRLYQRLLKPEDYVEYKLATWRDQLVSACETFIASNEELIPAWYVKDLRKKDNNRSEYDHYCEICYELDVSEAVDLLDKMLICDSVLANRDRHWRNFGLVRNVETLALRPAPIFDSGSSLWSGVQLGRLQKGAYKFTSKPFYDDPARQLSLVRNSRWFDPAALAGFPEEAASLIAEHVGIEELGEAIRRGIEFRIDQVMAWYKSTPKPVFVSSPPGKPRETFEYVILS